MTSSPAPVLRLKRGEERRLRAGHLWVYSNEVDTKHSPLKGLEPGGEVVIEDHRGRALGRAYANPESLICARLFSRKAEQSLSRSFLKKRIAAALEMRERLFPARSYRLVFGEGDGLPGLIVDRFGDDLVLQSGTAGMDRALDDVAHVLEAVCQPRSLVAKNDAGVRRLEGLESEIRVLVGDMPEHLALEENGLPFEAPVEDGQKTGWFYDHRAARRRLPALSRDMRVLDVFSYCGAWGVTAAAHGAAGVRCVDSSASALAFARRNAERNTVADRVETVQADAVTAMKEMAAAGERYDLVILDPPSFIKRRKDFRNGLAGYHNINELAMRLLEPGGYLVSASCSMHLSREKLLDVVRASGRHIDRFVQVLAGDGQSEDHPVHPAIAETAYLKSWLCRVTANP